MKRIVILATTLVVLVFPSPGYGYFFGVTEVTNKCFKNGYSVIYINGVLNSESDAAHGARELKKIVPDTFQGEIVKTYYAFNPSHIAGIGDSLTSVIQKTFDQAQHAMGLDYDAEEMISAMHDEVKEGRILFVPHSQGNFYANTIYDWLATREGGIGTSSMTMYNVASPAQMSAPNARYILSKNDKVIAGLVGSVGAIAPPNVDFPEIGSSKDALGHNFVDTYLHYGSAQMMKDIKAELATLEVDTGKDASLPCVPAPDTGVAHALAAAYFAIADPIAGVGASIFKGAAQFMSVLSGSVFSSAPQPMEELKGTRDLPDLKKEAPVTYPGFKPAVVLPVVQQDAPPVVKETTLPKKKPLKAAPAVDPDAEYKTALLERIALLKRMLKAESTLEKQVIASSVIRRSGSLPTARAHALEEASTTPIIVEQGGFTIEDNLPQSQESASIIPTSGQLLITEYYIGKDGESSWVELMNTTDKWLDMRNAEFIEDGEHYPFPLTGIPPKRFVVLSSDGTKSHAILQSEAPYRFIEGLSSRSRSSGEFVILANHSLVDRAPYGGAYCANAYALRRSCERMITIAPGDNPSYWVRARALDTPTQYENASTIGYANQSWKYNIYEGRRIAGVYPNEIIPRGSDAVYVTGEVTVQSGEEWMVGNDRSWVLALPDAAIFGGNAQTVIHVYGTLGIWKTGSISTNKQFANYTSESNRPLIETVPHIVVHEGGVFVRDPYTYLTAPVIVRGGVVRVNTIASRMRLESGKLFLTYFDDGTSPAEIPSCSTYRDRTMLLEWLGGKVYRIGVDCGPAIPPTGQDEGQQGGPDDPFGVLAMQDAEDCHVYYAARDFVDCNEYYGLPPEFIDPPPEAIPPVESTTTPEIDDEMSTSTATSTDDVPPVEDSQGDAVGTTTPADGSASSTEELPPPEDSGSGSSATTTESLSLIDSSSTSTATSTPVEDGSGSSTSTPPIDNGGLVAGTSTATSTPGEEGPPSSTSTPPIDGGGIVTGTSTATSTASGEDGSATTTESVFCYDGPLYYDGITDEELNATCGHGWAPRPELFPVTSGGWNPLDGRMQITEYYIGAAGESSWFKVSNMMGSAAIDLKLTDVSIAGVRIPFPVLSIPAREYVLIASDGLTAQAVPLVSQNGGVETRAEYIGFVLPEDIESSGTIRFFYTTRPGLPEEDIEIFDYERGVCPGIISSIGSCVLERPYLVGNYEGDAGYVPWSMPSTSEPSMSNVSSPESSDEAPSADNVVIENLSSDNSTTTPDVIVEEIGTSTSVDIVAGDGDATSTAP